MKSWWLALDPLREVLHVDRLGYVEVEDGPKIGASEQWTEPPFYKVARERDAVAAIIGGEWGGACVYHDRPITEEDYKSITAMVCAASA
jgi:hypothetical protein